MNIKIVNCPDADFKPFLVDAAEFFAKDLIPDGRLRNRCTVRIKFDDKLKVYGYASIEKFNSRNLPREFNIEIHPGLGARGILQTLSHEMVHVKQYINGETNDDLSHWRGKKIDSDTVDYWEHPWEIDAHGREVGLVHKYAVANQLWDIFKDFQDPTTPIESIPIQWK